GTGVQQPLSPVLDGDDLLLRLAPYRFDDERYESGGDPGGQRERGPAGDVGAPGGQLADDDEGGRGVAGGGDPAPRMVRRQRGGEGGRAVAVPPFERGEQAFERHRAAEEVTLTGGAALLPEPAALVFALHPFGDHEHAEAATEVDRGADHGGVGLGGVHGV